MKADDRKIRLIRLYTEYIRWSILLHIKFIRENKFPEQLQYWKIQLKNDLTSRKRVFEEIQDIEVQPENKQLKFEF